MKFIYKVINLLSCVLLVLFLGCNGLIEEQSSEFKVDDEIREDILEQADLILDENNLKLDNVKIEIRESAYYYVVVFTDSSNYFVGESNQKIYPFLKAIRLRKESLKPYEKSSFVFKAKPKVLDRKLENRILGKVKTELKALMSERNVSQIQIIDYEIQDIKEFGQNYWAVYFQTNVSYSSLHNCFMIFDKDNLKTEYLPDPECFHIMKDNPFLSKRELLIEKVRSKYNRGEYLKALKYYKKYMESYGKDNSKINLEVSEVFFSLGKLEEGQKFLKMSKNKELTETELLNKASIYFQNSEFEKALKTLSFIATENLLKSEEMTFYKVKGLINFALQDYSKALNDLNESYSHNGSNDHLVTLHLALLHLKNKDHEKARKVLSKLVEEIKNRRIERFDLSTQRKYFITYEELLTSKEKFTIDYKIDKKMILYLADYLSNNISEDDLIDYIQGNNCLEKHFAYYILAINNKFQDNRKLFTKYIIRAQSLKCDRVNGFIETLLKNENKKLIKNKSNE